MKSFSRITTFLHALLLFPTLQSAVGQLAGNEVRTWTSQDGKFTVEAEFVSYSDGKVRLSRNGKELSVPANRLSLKDHEYISKSSNWGRVWRNRGGEVLYVAKFDSKVTRTRVRLISITGSKITADLSSLDADSQSYIESETARRSRSLGPSGAGESHIRANADAPMNVEQSEKHVRQRIAECFRQSSRIRIDGKGADWHGIPTFTSTARINNGSLDIVRVGIAPREQDLVVMIQTRTRPSREAFSFFVRVDFVGQRSNADFQIGISGSSDQRLKIYDESNRSKTIVDKTIGGIQVQIREVIEVRIPYAAISSEFPPQMAERLSGDKSRPFVRVETLSYDRAARRIVDYGPAVASYRFLPRPYDLDGPAPGEGLRALPISVPFKGKWLVGHGAMGYVTHLDIFAYDFFVVDHQGSPAETRLSAKNADYYTWGLPIQSPVNGRVIRLENEHLDREPGQSEPTRSNKVVLAVYGDDQVQLRMIHFQKGSVNVAVGQKLNIGDEVALAGNSGFSAFPHLHLDLTRTTENANQQGNTPLAFEHVILSLNPTPDDPLDEIRRELGGSAWGLRRAVLISSRGDWI